MVSCAGATGGTGCAGSEAAAGFFSGSGSVGLVVDVEVGVETVAALVGTFVADVFGAVVVVEAVLLVVVVVAPVAPAPVLGPPPTSNLFLRLFTPTALTCTSSDNVPEAR